MFAMGGPGDPVDQQRGPTIAAKDLYAHQRSGDLGRSFLIYVDLEDAGMKRFSSIRAQLVETRFLGFALLLVLSMLPIAGSSDPVNLDLGRVVHYSFDIYRVRQGDWLTQDISGRRNHGILVNFDAPPAQTKGPGNNGRALVFDRTREQRIDVGRGTQPSLDLTRFTIAAWIRLTEDDTPERNWEVAEKAAAYWLNVRSRHDPMATRDKLRCGAYINGKIYRVDSATRVPRRQWVHVAGTFDGSHLRVFINGAPQGDLHVPGVVDQNDYPLSVGANNKPNKWADDPSRNWMMGAMDDFRLYNRALSGTELRALALR
jgi:hypothetical protein